MSRPAFHALAFGPQGGMVTKHGAEAATVLRFDVDSLEVGVMGAIKDGEPWVRISVLDQAAPVAEAEWVLCEGPWAILSGGPRPVMKTRAITCLGPLGIYWENLRP